MPLSATTAGRQPRPSRTWARRWEAAGAALLLSPLTGRARMPWVSAAWPVMHLSPRLTASPHSPSARREVSSARPGILGIDVYIITIFYIHYIVLILYMFMDTRFCIMYIIIVISFL